MQRRAQHPERHLEEFKTRVWIRCPRCDRKASVQQVGGFANGAVLTCGWCGLRKNSEFERWRWPRVEATDPYFGEQLWYQASFRRFTLWFYNLEHLQYVEDYVGAKLRERRPSLYGIRNGLLSSRLPRWMTNAQNRGNVLRLIQKLRRS